jgi:hypothetical protein
MNRGVRHANAALGHHRHEISIAQSVSDVPADAQLDDLGIEAATSVKYSTKDERHRGAYKTLRNDVEAFGPDGRRIGVVFETATPFDTPRLMSSLVAWMQQVQKTGEIHPLIAIAGELHEHR